MNGLTGTDNILYLSLQVVQERLELVLLNLQASLLLGLSLLWK